MLSIEVTEDIFKELKQKKGVVFLAYDDFDKFLQSGKLVTFFCGNLHLQKTLNDFISVDGKCLAFFDCFFYSMTLPS